MCVGGVGEEERSGLSMVFVELNHSGAGVGSQSKKLYV